MTSIAKPNKVNIIHFNARSLLSKMPELRLLVSSTKPHIIAVTETWLSSCVPNGAIRVHGYDTVYRYDRPDHRRGGGVLLLVRNNLSCTERPDLRVWPESVWAEIRLTCQTLIVGCLYRPPSSDSSILSDDLELTFNKIDFRHKVVLVGDFNATSPSWCSSDKYNVAGRHLEPSFLALGLHQCLSSPTHLRPDGSFGALLDLVLTNHPSSVTAVTTHPPVGSSDHLVVQCSLSFKTSSIPLSDRHPKLVWCYERADMRALNNALMEADWPGVRDAENIDDAWECWQLTFMSTVNKFVPHKTIHKFAKKNPWVTPDVEKAIKEKRAAFRRFKKDPRQETRRNFTTLRNRVTYLIRKSERAHTATLHRSVRLSTSPSSSQEFWRYVRNVTGKTRHTAIPDLVEPLSNRTVSLAQEKANLLNSFFVQQTMLDGSDDKRPDRESLAVNANTFSYLETNPAKVFEVLSSLKPNKAAGLDGIPPRLLKLCCRSIACSLTCLFNRSFELSQFPQAWRDALVVPIHKKGNSADPGNYRPIALLSTVSKVLERIVHDKLSTFLRPWLSKQQSGFRKKDGTVPQLVRLTQQWSETIDKSAYVGVLFFDLKKAFDRVWHRGLLTKLQAAGIRGSALSWFTSFLAHRRQTTLVDCFMSPLAAVEAGVPQGAILSPLLFSVYINDLVSAASLSEDSKHGTSRCEINMFADDTLACVSSPREAGLNLQLQLAADTISKWFDLWRLSVNTSKTVCMVLRSRRMPPCSLTIFIHSVAVPQVQNHRHLGITFTEYLSWSDHVTNIINRASSKIGLLRRLRYRITPNVIRDLYIYCIRPTLEYANIVWSGLSASDIARLERCNRRAARLISGIDRHAIDIPHALILARAGIQLLSVRRKIAQAQFVRKMLMHRLPDHLMDAVRNWLPPKEPATPERRLRQSKIKIRLPRPRTNSLKHSPIYSASTVWHKLLNCTHSVVLPSNMCIISHFDN